MVVRWCRVKVGFRIARKHTSPHTTLVCRQFTFGGVTPDRIARIRRSAHRRVRLTWLTVKGEMVVRLCRVIVGFRIARKLTSPHTTLVCRQPSRRSILTSRIARTRKNTSPFTG